MRSFKVGRASRVLNRFGCYVTFERISVNTTSDGGEPTTEITAHWKTNTDKPENLGAGIGRIILAEADARKLRELLNEPTSSEYLQATMDAFTSKSMLEVTQAEIDMVHAIGAVLKERHSLPPSRQKDINAFT